MSREWKPGDLAMLSGRGGTEIGLCFEAGRTNGRSVSGVARWRTTGWDRWSSVGEARPLIVIDPEDPEQTEWFWRMAGQSLASFRETLREYADPKPEEPQGLGAVVRDAEGRRFVRFRPDGGPAKWALATTEPVEIAHVWSAIDAVEVLSEGVTP